MMSHPAAEQERQEAVQRWAEETDSARRLGRQFSGDRMKRIVRGDWLTRAAFVAGTAAVLFFVFAQDSKEERALKKGAHAAEKADEPSVRDFRPLVMPGRFEPPQERPAPLARTDEKPAQPTPIDAEAAARRRSAEQLAEARMKSDIVVKAPVSASPPALAAAVSSAPLVGMPGTTGMNFVAGSRDALNDPNSVFAEQSSGRPVLRSFPRKLANLSCVALQGKFIEAELETGINTDLPGPIRAVISTPLYAEQGRQVLLTPGSRLIGLYNSAVRKGQVRVFAIWNRVIRPDGVEAVLDSSVTDALGRAGLVGDTDNHFVQTFALSALLSIIGAGTSTIGVSGDTRYNSADEYRRQVQQGFGRSADRLLEPYAGLPPTNTIRQGERIRIFLNRDLDFCPLQVAVQERRELVLP